MDTTALRQTQLIRHGTELVNFVRVGEPRQHDCPLLPGCPNVIHTVVHYSLRVGTGGPAKVRRCVWLLPGLLRHRTSLRWSRCLWGITRLRRRVHPAA
eukprot:6058038-Amphidinium_carterae.1